MPQLDSLDLRIIRVLGSPGSLQWNVRESSAAIARKIEADDETVRRRILRMRRAGILKTPRLVLNPHLIGREFASVDFDVKDGSTKRLVTSRLTLIDGVISILDLQGDRVSVAFLYRSEKELARQISRMEASCDCRHSALWRLPFPPVQARLNRADWTILSILHKDTRKKVEEIAEEANLSSKTVNRRLGLMVKRHYFFLDSFIDFTKVEGLAYRILISSLSPEAKSRIDRWLLTELEHIEWFVTGSRTHSMFVLIAKSFAEASQVSNMVQGLQGLSEARLDIIRNQLTLHDWIQGEIETKLADFSAP